MPQLELYWSGNSLAGWNIDFRYMYVEENGGKGVLCVLCAQYDVTSVPSIGQSWHRIFHLFSAFIITDGHLLPAIIISHYHLYHHCDDKGNLFLASTTSFGIHSFIYTLQLWSNNLVRNAFIFIFIQTFLPYKCGLIFYFIHLYSTTLIK